MLNNNEKLKHIRFTISFSPETNRVNPGAFRSQSFLDELKSLRSKIQDINFTYHMEPFIRDAHGVYLSKEENEIHLSDMLYIQEKTGIPVSPVFNNIYIENNIDAQKLFIKNFWALYERGIRNLSVPHMIWMLEGSIRKTFDNLFIKDTVLRKVSTAQEFWNSAKAGYNYINLNQTLVRNRRELIKIKEAQIKFYEITGKYQLTSLLHGEGCQGNCPLWVEHYQHTLTHRNLYNGIDKNKEIFRYPTTFFCNNSEKDQHVSLSCVGMPPFYDDFEEICSYIDIIKLPGRNSNYSYLDNVEIVRNFEKIGLDSLLPNTEKYLETLQNGSDKDKILLKNWREKIKNCRFQCWNCDLCTKVYTQGKGV